MIWNAQIKSTMLGYEEHGIFMCSLSLEQGFSEQRFGGRSLYANKEYSIYDVNEYCIYTDLWVKRILEVVGVRKWEDLKGKYVRVKGESSGPIEAIGHIVEENWFYPKQEIEEQEKGSAK